MDPAGTVRGVSKGVLKGFGVALLIFALILIIGAVTALLSASGWMNFTDYKFIPNARNMMGNTGAWSATGLAVGASVVVGLAGGLLLKLAGGEKTQAEQDLLGMTSATAVDSDN